jgi:short-subunit dehydrogenase
MYGKVMREEVRENNIKVVNIYPGAVKTDIRDPEELAQCGDRMMEASAVAALVYNACKSAMT